MRPRFPAAAAELSWWDKAWSGSIYLFGQSAVLEWKQDMLLGFLEQ